MPSHMGNVNAEPEDDGKWARSVRSNPKLSLLCLSMLYFHYDSQFALQKGKKKNRKSCPLILSLLNFAAYA